MSLSFSVDNFLKQAESALVLLFAKHLADLLNKDVPIEDAIVWLQNNNPDLANEDWSFNFNPPFLMNSKRDMILSIDKLNLPLLMNKINFNPGVTINEESILSKTNNIPKLYLYKFELEKKKIQDFENKNTRFKYLTDFLRIYGRIYLFKPEKMILDILDNKSRIEQMEKMFDYIPKQLGSGDSGIAYDIGKNKVLKLFKDQHIYDKAMEAMERLHKQPEIADTEAMIYDAAWLGKFHGISVYYYIMEKLVPADKEFDLDELLTEIIFFMQKKINFADKKKFNALRDKFDQILTSSGNFTELVKEIREIVLDLKAQLKQNKEMKHKIQKASKQFGLDQNWLEGFLKEIIMKFLTRRTDLHVGNLGITKHRKLRYFDPAHPELTNIIKAV